jgi:arabinan endo-1,5-alpha-L-arabinosidase
MRIRSFLVISFLLSHSVLSFGSMDYSDFQSLLNESKRLLNVAVEGSNQGEYALGSKAAFEQSILQYETASTACDTILELDSVTNCLHDAYLTFTHQRYGIQRPLATDNCWEVASNTSKWGPFNLHDPSCIKTKGYYYVYGTDAAWASTVKGIPYRRSRDLVTWEYLGTAFSGVYPAQNVTWIDSMTATTGHTQTGIWAPYIMKVGEEYRMYYSAIFDPSGAVICLAIAKHPKGPWTQRGPIVHYQAGYNANGIDPTVTIGKDGKHWFAWGSWTKGIYMLELDPSTGLKKAGTAETKIACNRVSSSSMEGPEIIYNPILDKYYLFVAEGDLGTVYQTRVARSDNPNGPYVDIYGNSVVYSTKKDIYPLLSYAYKFNNHPGWQGVAHCSVINDNGQFYMLNQGRPSSIPEMMDMHVKKIYWTENGWPVISPERYANKGVMPTITADQLAGTWEEILLDEYKSNGVSVDVPTSGTAVSTYQCKSTTYTFNPSGSITPTGTWSYNDTTQRMTIIKGGYTYKVNVDWEWDWENGCTTLIYTGLRTDGRTYWGKKSLYLDRTNVNIVPNPAFDKSMDGYLTTAATGSVTTSLTNASSGTLQYISGNTFKALINTQATNYWDQGLSVRFPAQQGSRYIINFNYRVSPRTPMHVELQEAANDFTALYRDSVSLVDAAKFEQITNDVSATNPNYTLNIQYGYAPAGNKILLDNITITDITNQWDGNYVVNGGFEYGLDSWTKYILASTTLTGGVIDTAIISDNKSFCFHNTSNLSNSRLLNRLYWAAYLQSGWKYKVSFDVKGSGTADAYVRLSTAASTVVDITGLYGVAVNAETTHYTFEIPTITTTAQYTLNFSPRDAGIMLFDNIRLDMIPDTTTAIQNNPMAGQIGIRPNPCYGTIHLPDHFLGCTLQITDLRGLKRYSQLITNTSISIPLLSKGVYLVRIQTSKGLYTDKLIYMGL